MRQCSDSGFAMLDSGLALWHNHACKRGIPYADKARRRAGFFAPI